MPPARADTDHRRAGPEQAVEREEHHAQVVADPKLEHDAEAAEGGRSSSDSQDDGGNRASAASDDSASVIARNASVTGIASSDRMGDERPEQLRLPLRLRGGLADDHLVDPELAEVAEQVADREDRAPLAEAVLAERAHDHDRHGHAQHEVEDPADELNARRRPSGAAR